MELCGRYELNGWNRRCQKLRWTLGFGVHVTTPLGPGAFPVTTLAVLIVVAQS